MSQVLVALLNWVFDSNACLPGWSVDFKRQDDMIRRRVLGDMPCSRLQLQADCRRKEQRLQELLMAEKACMLQVSSLPPTCTFVAS